MDIGKRIVQLREERGLTTNRLANLCGISQSFLRSVELGEKGISVGSLQLICGALGVSMARFFVVFEKRSSADEELTSMIRELDERQKQALADFLRTFRNN